MIKLPLSIDNVLKGKKDINEKIIYQDNNFIVLVDKKHSTDSYHYTAWAINDIRSLIEIDINIINKLNQIKQILIDKKFIDNFLSNSSFFLLGKILAKYCPLSV